MHFGTDCAELLVARVHCLSSGSAQESGFLPSTGEKKSNLAQRWCTGGCAAAGGSVRVPGATGGRWGSYNGPGRVSTGLICIEPPDQHPRNLDLSKSYPRHPGRNFTESRVRRRALSRRRTSRDGRTPRPSVKQFPLRTNDFAFKRKPVRAREQWQVLALFFTTPKYPRVCFFATQARHSRGFRLHVRLTLRLVEPPPPPRL
jgi:hypothetical protein